MSKLPHDYSIDTRISTKAERELLIDFLRSKGYKFYNSKVFINDGGTTFVFDQTDGDWCRSDRKPDVSLQHFLNLFVVNISTKTLSEHLTNPIYYKPIDTNELGQIIIFPTGVYVNATGAFIPHSTKELL